MKLEDVISKSLAIIKPAYIDNNINIINISKTNAIVKADLNTKTINETLTGDYLLENDIYLNITLDKILYNDVDIDQSSIIVKNLSVCRSIIILSVCLPIIILFVRRS